MSDILKNAAQIAKAVHSQHTRANGVEPYINHCKRVSGMIARDFPLYGNDTVIATAILHDTLEDCPYNQYIEVYNEIAQKCGSKVAAYVELLTKPRDFKEYSNIRYLNTIAISPPAIQTIKAVDRIDNLQTITDVWDVERCMHYLKDSVKIRDILKDNNLDKQANLLNVHIVAAQSRVVTQHTSKHS